MDIEELNKNIVDLENPVLIATELGFFISDGCSDGSLSLYEAFLLTDTELQLLQKGAIQPAWNYSFRYEPSSSIRTIVCISDLLQGDPPL